MLYKLHVYYMYIILYVYYIICDASWVVLNVNGKLSKKNWLITVS